tara:strand:- start:1324 stop:1704 length:381 start_codon:yes stop_codon:yes gene_type:complete
METITKKVLKTENRPEYMKNYMKDKPDYMKNYMREYTKKNNEKIICDICSGKYKCYSKYLHVKTNKHTTQLLKNELDTYKNKKEDLELGKDFLLKINFDPEKEQEEEEFRLSQLPTLEEIYKKYNP